MITLTTDFGLCDPFVGVMKGVIGGIAPTAPVVDLCHGIPPQDILAGALTLEESVAYFPTGTIHVAVIDPGVGSARAPIALETERATYIGPDNGLFDFVLKKERLKRAVKLENPEYRLAVVSHTFHGRDIFAPAAAHLFNGVPLDTFGPPITEITTLKMPKPCVHGEKLQLHILRVDHFGNIITDLKPADYAAWNAGNGPVKFEFMHTCFIGSVLNAFAGVPEGAPVAYFGSGDWLEIAIRNGNAAGYFKVARGFSVVLEKL